MYFLALAIDYDGTLARDGVVDSETVIALKKFKETGRRLILVTGRELPHIKEPFPQLTLFDRVVAENGALVYNPATEKERLIAAGPVAALVERLKELDVAPLSVGRSIVATWEPHETTVLEVIRELGLDLQIIFNKGAVMVLPAGINKAAGLSAALQDLDLSHHNVVGVGDAENDQAFLRECGCAAAVANALPSVKGHANIKLLGNHGAGVIELMERICRDDARIADPEMHGILLGAGDRSEVVLEPYRGNVLIAGKSGIGKSTLAIALTERMQEKQFQFCVFDPEGDYDELENAVSIGDVDTSPTDDEAIKLLRQCGTNVVINTQSLGVAERPSFFENLLPQVAMLRARTGRPHWLVIDEAHHLLPAQRGDVAQVLPEGMSAVIFITVHPEAVSPDALKSVQVVVALGDGAEVIADFCKAIRMEVPEVSERAEADEVLVWNRSSGQPPQRVKPQRPRQAHKRHTRKYAEGDLGEELSFYFRGPDNALNLRAQNLMLFLQIADGVDDRTWMHHLRKGDFSDWFRNVIKDGELADEAAEIEANSVLDPLELRQRMGNAVTQRYTSPAVTRDH